jgi:Leucine-rich repeat (LRR) protein
MGAVIRTIDGVRQDFAYDDIVKAIRNGNRTLDLRHRSLRNVPTLLSRLDEIVEVQLAHNLLTTLPGSIGSMKNLQILRLQNCQLEELPETFGDLSKLRILDVSRNELLGLPESFGRLIALEEFYGTKNEIKRLSENFAHGLYSLRSLNLDSNRLADLPSCFTQLKALTYCDLSDNMIKELPPAIGRMDELQTLLVNKNMIPWRGIPMGPQGLPKLKMLKGLYFMDNKIEQCPWEFGLCTSLQNLAISRNRYLTVLPDELGDLPRIRSLACNDCKLASIPKMLYTKTTMLRDLDLSTNSITSLPDTVGKLLSLESLYLSRNRLSGLPPTIGALSNLKELCIEENSIKTLPDELGNCKVSTIQNPEPLSSTQTHTFPRTRH